jgi:galactitol 2-dehydrogenase (L-tagatose-forming)
VITGGARGIGYESATALSQCGAHVVLADLNAAGLADAVRRLESGGATASSILLDVTDPKVVDLASDDLVSRHGKVDILVNSAGIARLNSGIETPDEEWRLVMNNNVNRTFWCSRAFGRHMVTNGDGRIVNLGSMSGLIINRPQAAAAYLTSKGAVHMLTKELAAEWVKSGVRVNALAPGYVATDMTLKMRERPELFNVWLDMTPIDRLGDTTEIAAAVLYLASRASGYVTGAILSIDGG